MLRTKSMSRVYSQSLTKSSAACGPFLHVHKALTCTYDVSGCHEKHNDQTHHVMKRAIGSSEDKPLYA